MNWRAALLGFGLGAAIAATLVGFTLPARLRKAQEGWDLQPVIVAVAELPAGSTLTFDHLSQRAVPSRFVATSHLGPGDASKVVNRVLRAPLQPGDPVTEADFVEREHEGIDACRRARAAARGPGDAGLVTPP